jgi:fructokinase
MTEVPNALVIGEAIVDVVKRGPKQPAEHPGGSPLNVAVGLGRLDMPTTLVTWFGRDERGQMIQRHLADSGVHIAPGSDRAPATGTSLATIDDDGAASYQFELSWDLPPVPRWVAPAVVHTGSIATTLEPGADKLAQALASYAGKALITYDPNARPGVMGSADEVRVKVEELVGLADVVKVSDEDLGWLFPDSDPLEAAAEWLEGGTSLVVVTRGGAGSVGMCQCGTWVEMPAEQTVVVDTVGAGDAFMAGLIWAIGQAGYLGAVHRAELGALTDQALEDILYHAGIVSGISVGRAGANPPTLGEVRRAIQSRPNTPRPSSDTTPPDAAA